MSKTIREHICNIQVEKSNLEHIATTGQINGSLLLSIEKTMNDYSESQTQELQQQNEELVNFLQFLSRKGGLGLDVHAKIDDLLTKHNHLNKK